ncbi:MAG: dTMP kinase [Planctomycetes bacterium]|nr:dTMP kinase [Planctomycetota bacterium]
MLICFEGIDGSGKTTISSAVAARLRDLGFTVFHPRENDRIASRVASKLRSVTRDVENFELNPRSELLVNLAREVELLALVRERLERGEVVISDRFVYSHYAMALARGLSIDLEEIVPLAALGREPEMVILVDCDPDVAWLRKRARKIETHRVDEEGRKGAVLEDPCSKLAAVYRRLARERGWEVIENSCGTIEHAVVSALSLIGARLNFTVPPHTEVSLPAWSFSGDLEELSAGFFTWVRAIADRDPALAAMLVHGMESGRADRIRVALASRVPAIIASGLTGLEGAEPWRLRLSLASSEPEYVARSLVEMEDEGQAGELRRRLARAAPSGVLWSLRGADDEESDALREQLWEAAPEAGLRSLEGLDTLRAWAWRFREFRRRPSGALARSLEGLDTMPAWTLRRRLRETFPYSVLRSVSRLTSPQAWDLRRGFGGAKAVVETIAGLDAAEAWELRLRKAHALPESVAASLRGLGTLESNRLREALCETAPLGVLHSLKGNLGESRSMELLRRIVRRDGRRLRVAREAVRLLCNEFAEVHA